MNVKFHYRDHVESHLRFCETDEDRARTLAELKQNRPEYFSHGRPPVESKMKWLKNGRAYPFRNDTERRMQYMLADAGLPSAPRNLKYEERGDIIYAVARSGRYQIGTFQDSPRLWGQFLVFHSELEEK